MYAKLVSKPDFVVTVGNSAGDRLKDISNIITGDINSTNIETLLTFDPLTSSIVDTIQSNWTVTYQTPAAFAMAHNAAGTIIWQNNSRVAGKKKFFKFTHTATTTAMIGFIASNYTSGGVATNETNISHVGWALSSIPVLYIKSTPDCLLFFAVNNDSNAATTEPDILGVIERTTFTYDVPSVESPFAYMSINGVDASTGCKVVNKYNPSLDSYTPIADLSTRFKIFATTGSTPSISRDDQGRVAAPFIPLVIDDLATGWVGGSLSEYSGFFRSANDLGRSNDLVVKDAKNYRVWPVSTYRYLVEES